MAKTKKVAAKKKAAPPKKEPKKVMAAKSSKVAEKKEAQKDKKEATTEIKASKKHDAKQVKAAPVKPGAPQNTAPHTMTAGTGKKRLLISYDKLPDEVVDIIRAKYPYGYNHDLKEVKGIDNKKFSVLPIELPEVVYLVKVDLRKPFKIEEAEDEEDVFTPEEGFAPGEEDNFPGEELEAVEGEGDDEEDTGKKKKKKKDDDDDDDI